jgi:hypothetical protein
LATGDERFFIAAEKLPNRLTDAGVHCKYIIPPKNIGIQVGPVTRGERNAN